MRVFVAFELPPDVREAAAAIQRELMQPTWKVAWVRTEAMHLTLRFLGEVAEFRLGGIQAAIRSAVYGTGPIHIVVRGLGVFPGPKKPRVIWIGIEPDDDRLFKLEERIGKALTSLGFPRENRKFTPHLTLGRVKDLQGIDEVMKSMGDRWHVMAGSCTLAELKLIQSELRREGAVYTNLWSVAL